MSQAIRVLSAKLMTPRTNDTIVRERLRPVFGEIIRKKVTAVSAGAGYGKTTLIAQAVHSLDSVWYRLDSLDRDLVTFLSYLVAGTGKIYPGFGKETMARLEEGTALGLEYEAVLSLFVQELDEALDKDFIIVLEDYHVVRDTKLIRDAVQFLCDNLCRKAHLVIIGRTDPLLNLSRLRSTRDVLDIRTEDLLFTTEEIGQLFRQMFHLDIPPDALDELHSRTAGWVSALILFFHSVRLKDTEEIKDHISGIRGSGRFISEYLEENVYRSLPNDVRDFLVRTSILPRLNPALCNELLEIKDAGNILNRLFSGHMFTFMLDEDSQEYFYHHLFQEYLQTMFRREILQDEQAHLHRRAAFLLEKTGDVEAALEHYLSSGDFDMASDIIERLAVLIVSSGRLELIRNLLGRIPKEVVEKRPWMLYIRASADDLSGRHQEAIKELSHVLDLFREQHDRQGIDRCLNDMAMRLYISGDYARAYEIFSELLKSDILEPVLRVETQAHLLFITSQWGRFEESDRLYEQTLRLIAGIDDPLMQQGTRALAMIFHGFRHVVAGDQARAIELGLQAREILRNIDANRLIALSYQLIVSAHTFNGSFELGYEEALSGLQFMEEKGFCDTTLGWIYRFAGSNAVGLGMFGEGIRYARKALDHFRLLEAPYGQANAYYVLLDTYRLTGRFDLAEEAGYSALETVSGLHLPQITGPLKASLADTFIVTGRLDEAETLIEEAEKTLTYSTLFNYWIARLHARLSWHRGLHEQALEWLHKGLDIAEAHRHERWVLVDWGWLLPMLVTLYARGSHRSFIQTIFNLLGRAVKETLVQYRTMAGPDESEAASSILRAMLHESAPGLRIHCLGRFRVSVGEREIPTEEWKSRKAKTLFKLLLHYRSRGFVSKEVFMEHLWPEEDPAKTAKRFHVALTTLRRILEPDLERGLQSAYLKADGDTYHLELGKEGFVDLDAFEDACRQAGTTSDTSRSIEHLLEAERLCQGDFLAEDLYEPWCMEERERIRTMHLSVLASIIEYYEMKRDHGKAISTCARYLAIDAYAEDIYQVLMRQYGITGNKTMVIKTYERCRELITGDLGCSLTSETELLFKELMG